MKKGFLFTFAILLLISCQQKQESGSEIRESATPQVAHQLDDKLDLNKVIIQTPPPIVSTTAELDIEFNEPVAPGHFVGTILNENPFTFKPEIKGSAKWLSNRLLRFVPDKNLPSGQAFQVTLIGKVAFGKQKSVSDFTFKFKVAEQEILKLEGDFEPVPNAKNQVQYRGKMTFAQEVLLEEVQDDFRMRGDIGRTDVTFEPGDNKDEAIFISEKIQRTKNGQRFTFELPKKYTANQKKWKKEIFLHGIDIFRVVTHMDMSDSQEAGLNYGFRFSEPIMKDVDLSGYVAIEPEIDYELRIQNKYLMIQGDFLPGQTYTINISSGFPSVFGTKLENAYRTQFSFNNIKPELNWLSSGVYLPSSNEYKLQFKSVNVRRVRIRVTKILPQNVGFFLQSNALMDESEMNRSIYSSFMYHDLHRVGVEIYNELRDITNKKNEWIKTELDLTSVFKDNKNAVFVIQLNYDLNDLTGRCVTNRDNLKEGDLFYEETDYYSSPCSPGYYYSHGSKSKLLIASDIGLTIKKAGGKIHVFSTDVNSARPVSGLSLGLYSYQNQLLESKETNGDGYAAFQGENGSYVYGKHESGIALMRVDHHAWQINNFDISGSSHDPVGTNVFIYTDRGVHRPGDTVYLSAIIRTNNQSPVEKQPILLEVKNPRGQVMLNARTQSGINGHVSFEIPTDLNDPTGNWTARLEIGSNHFYHTLKIETVKPNRLKIDMELPDKIIPPALELRGTITTKYLFGAPASGLLAVMEADFTEQTFKADKFAEFIFTSPIKQYETRSKKLGEQTLDAEGKWHFSHPIPNIINVPSLLDVHVKTTVFEKGGNFVQHASRTTVYPFTGFAGVKNTFGWDVARINQKVSIPIIVVDRDGNPLDGHRVQVRLYVNTGYWWYHYDNRERQDFRTRKATYKIDEKIYQSEMEPILHELEIDDQGQHFLEVTDLTSGHQTGFFFYASQWGWEVAQDDKERKFLQITLDKNVYYVGDKAMISFPTPDEGMVLLSIEKGEQILQQRWKPVSKNETTFQLDITEEMLPNCYASISLIQPHNQNTNDAPIRLYGIKTIYVEDEDTRLPLTLFTPEKLEPKKPFSIRVKSRSKQKATYTIAIVDEGLLDLTAFQTPSPWNYFFQKIRLMVRTCDNFEEIMGILLPDIDKYLTIGGGLFAAEAKMRDQEKRLDPTQVKRFKPVVLFKGPVTINPGRTVTTEFTMPNYVGAVRVMVVGSAGHSYTSLEETVPVKQPLMILPTIPRVVRPEDTFAVPVSVFAMDSTIREVDVSITSSPNLSIIGSKCHPVTFTKPGEKDCLFSIKTGQTMGADSITVRAVSGVKQADYTVNLPVTSSNPFYTQVTDTTVMKASVVLIPEKIGLEGTNEARLSFSRIPDIQLDKRLKYLIRYPYGCIEQTISSVFPQLFLPHLTDLKSYQSQAITDNINVAIKHLKRYQIKGGFSYWPPSLYQGGKYHDWGTSYAGHFLLEAKNLGYHVPPSLFDHWLNDAQQNAKKVNEENHRYQAYRLFLLALAGMPDMGAMNLVRENYFQDLDPLSKKLLAAAYYISGQKNVAYDIEKTPITEVNTYRELGGTFGTAIRDMALMTYLCLKMDDVKTASRLLQKVNGSFRSHGWYSTHETSMAIMAIGTYYRTVPFTGGGVKFTVEVEGHQTQTISLTGYQTTMNLNDMWGKKITITSDEENPVFVYLYEEGIPLEDRIKTENSGLELSRNFYDENGQSIAIDTRKQGESFWVIYTVRSTYGEKLENLALSSIFPAGWEIINFRVTGENPPPWVNRKNLSQGTYMDIRDDRINLFFDLQPGSVIHFGAKLNPTFKGEYALPPLAVEAMYSPEFYARIKGDRVVVQ